MKSVLPKKVIAILILSLTAVCAVSAEDTDAFSEFQDALGAYYGEIGGWGLSYQHWFGNIGIQSAAGCYYDGEDSNYTDDAYSSDSVTDTVFTYNIGVEVMYKVYTNTFKNWFDSCLYVFAGVMHTGNIDVTYNYSQTGTLDSYGDTLYAFSSKSSPSYSAVFNPGFGIGFEIVLFKHFSIPVEVGLMGSWELGSAMPVDAGIRGQAGFRYRY